jgi:Rrf2 family nitric oxide-sensitive transcriptional repressor
VHRLNRKVEYALMALKIIANKRQGDLTSAKEVVEHTGCPFDATARVLQQLAQRSILRSEQGAHGGYLLLRDLNKVSLFDVMEIVLGPVAAAKCLEREGSCDLKQTCNIITPMSIFNRRLTEFYQDLSIAELLRVRDRADESRASL